MTTTTKETRVNSLEEAKNLIDIALRSNTNEELKAINVWFHNPKDMGIDVKFTWIENDPPTTN